MVTIREIAKQAGVSKSTVSLALRRDSRCSSKTVEKIDRIAKKLGYRPDPLVRANMTYMRRGNRRKRVQSILAYFYDISRGSPYELLSFKGASNRAEELGFALAPFPYNDPSLKPKRLLQILRNRNVQGILIAETPGPVPHIEFDWKTFAVATIGYTLQSPRVDRIGYDHVDNMNQLYQILRNRNYKRVGLAVRSDFDDRVTHSPIANYLGYQYSYSPDNPLEVFIEDENWNETSFKKWFQANKPDCIVTVGNDVGKWLARAGMRVPQDVGIFSIWGNVEFDNTNYSHFNVSIEQLSRTAIDVLSEQLNTNSRGVPKQRRSILIAGEIIHKKSLRAIAG